MKKLGIMFLAVLSLALLIRAVNSRSMKTRAQAVRVGDTRQNVERLLGRPVTVFTPSQQASTNFLAALLSVRTETWAYGDRLDLRQPFHSEFPYFYPFRLRLFQPDADDIAVEFDSSGRVVQVTIP